MAKGTPAAKKAVRRPAAARAAPDLGWRRGNAGRLLNNAVKRFESRILHHMQRDGSGYEGFTPSHIAITRNLDLEGTRASELARRAGITKQSMGELIIQLEARGIVERRPDPTDGRAKIVFFTPAGLQWLDAFGAALSRAEQEMRDALGPDALEALKQALHKYDQE